MVSRRLTRGRHMNVQYVTLRKLDYTGSEDCVAIKPHSYNVGVINTTCHSRTGIAVDSLG
ncbi:hypothetical protein F4803DRAFT_530308 [Xylaria telfairii]|nr:hypothetical protein F4803DRAFT_530308 [Xylaria telfairii]